MLKETETEETMGFFVTFLSFVAFRFGEGNGPPGSPLGTPMAQQTKVEPTIATLWPLLATLKPPTLMPWQCVVVYHVYHI